MLSFSSLLKFFWNLIKKIITLLLAGLLTLIVAYSIFKIWELQSYSNKNQPSNFLSREEFDVAHSIAIDYIPLLVGSSSIDFLQSKNGKIIFQYLLNEEYPNFLRGFEVSNEIKYTGSQIMGTGCFVNSCKNSGSAFLIDPSSNRIYAAIVENGTSKLFGINKTEAVFDPLQNWISSFVSDQQILTSSTSEEPKEAREQKPYNFLIGLCDVSSARQLGDPPVKSCRLSDLESRDVHSTSIQIFTHNSLTFMQIPGVQNQAETIQSSQIVDLNIKYQIIDGSTVLATIFSGGCLIKERYTKVNENIYKEPISYSGNCTQNQVIASKQAITEGKKMISYIK